MRWALGPFDYNIFVALLFAYLAAYRLLQLRLIAILTMPNYVNVDDSVGHGLRAGLHEAVNVGLNV